jgi:hypothetical protein
MDWTDALQQRLGGTSSTVTKRVMSRFADDFGLVYFGHVDQHDDEHKLVRGVTLSSAHKDRHYCVGTIQEYDAVVLQRIDTLTFPGKPKQSYTWLIMQFDLRSPHQVGHMFLDAHHYKETFFAHLFTKHSRLQKVDRSHFSGYEPMFVRGFDVYTSPDQHLQVPSVLTKEVTTTLGHHFRSFDFEITSEHVLVYSSNPIVTRSILEHMMRVGLWLSRHIDGATSP